MRLNRKERLRLSRGAHKSTRDGVSVYLDAFDVHMGDLIGPTGLRSPTQVYCRGGLESAVGAAVEKHPRLMGDDGALTLDPRFELDDGSVARIACGQFLDVVHDHLHWAASAHGQEVGHGDVHGRTLAPVVPANGHWIQADAL